MTSGCIRERSAAAEIVLPKHVARLMRALSFPLFLLLSNVGSGAVGFPTFVAKVELPGSPVLVRPTPDGRRAIVMLFHSNKEPVQQGVVLDLESPAAPALKSTFTEEGTVEQIAIAPDGAKALLVVAKPIGEGAQRTREVVALDLHDPGHPLERARRAIPGTGIAFGLGGVAIASDAVTYAFSQPSASQQFASDVVVRNVSNDQAKTVVLTATTTPTLFFSMDARFLAFGTNQYAVGSVGVIDLSASPTKLYRQEYMPYEGRYRCVFGVESGGYVLLSDARIPRLGVYAAVEAVPRVGRLDFPSFEGLGIDACDLFSQDSQAGMISVATTDSIERIDVSNPRMPKASGRWVNPVGTRPLALAESLVFATDKSGKGLQLLQLNDHPENAGGLDWEALAAAYENIMTRYRSSQSATRNIDAFLALRDAGAPQAVELGAPTISAKKAAAILNDYGYLATVNRSDRALSEAALRRAIQLDPDRAVGYLNLADLLRTHLGEVSGAGERRVAESEISGFYATYYSKGGSRRGEIDRYLNSVRSDQGTRRVCQAVASYANDGRLEGLIADRAFGVDVGGRRVDLLFTTEGTSHTPTWYVFDSGTDSPATISVDAPWVDSLWGGDQLGLLVYQGTPLIIHYRDARHPVHTASLAGGPACEFSLSATEKVSPHALEPELCHALAEGGGPEGIEFKLAVPAALSQEEVAKRYGETGADKMARLDFENSGAIKNVLALSLSSGAGAGCEEEFFDVASETGDRLADGTDHELIAKMQHLTDNRYPVSPCGNSPRFFAYGNKIYFESKAAQWPPVDTWNEYHFVTRIDNAQVHEVCGMTFEPHVVGHEGLTTKPSED